MTMKAKFTTLFVLAMIGALMFMRPGAESASSAPQDLFDRYVQAMNSGNLAAAIDLFTVDAILEPGGPGGGGRCSGGRCLGKEAIGSQLQGQIGDGHQVRIIVSSPSGNRLTGSYELRSRMTAARQTERLVFTFALEERDGLIALLQFQPDARDSATVAFFGGRLEGEMTPPRTGNAGLK